MLLAKPRTRSARAPSRFTAADRVILVLVDGLRPDAKRLDMAIGLAAALGDVTRDPRTLFALVSSHGGRSGTRSDDSHALDVRVPIILAGSPMPVALGRPVTLLDVSATILYALGQAIPQSYAGRPLVEAFVAGPAGMSRTQAATARPPFTPSLS